MRLLFLEWIPTSGAGGQELGMLDVCTGLAARGHDVTLGYAAPGDLLPIYARAGVRGIELTRYAPLRSAPFASSLEFARKIARAARLPMDAVIANAYYSTFFGAALSRIRRVPLLCHLRLCPPEGMSFFWRAGTRDVSRFIAVSNTVRDEWSRFGIPADAIDVVYEGIDAARFQPSGDRQMLRARLGLAPDDFTLLSVGRVVPDKNPDGLLRVFRRVFDAEPNARLLVAGPILMDSSDDSHRYRRQLLTLAASLGVADRVSWLGTRQDMPDLYRAADVLVHLSHGEALPRAPIEAHLCGTPSIVNRCGGTPEVLYGELDRFLVDARDIDATAATILALRGWRHAHPALARLVRESAVARFTRDAMVAGVEASIARSLTEPLARRGPRLAAFRPARSAAAV